jgi:hypothetical protein
MNRPDHGYLTGTLGDTQPAFQAAIACLALQPDAIAAGRCILQAQIDANRLGIDRQLDWCFHDDIEIGSSLKCC